GEVGKEDEEAFGAILEERQQARALTLFLEMGDARTAVRLQSPISILDRHFLRFGKRLEGRDDAPGRVDGVRRNAGEGPTGSALGVTDAKGECVAALQELKSERTEGDVIE